MGDSIDAQRAVAADAGISRRRLIGVGAGVAAAAWVAPSVLSVQAVSAQSAQTLPRWIVGDSGGDVFLSFDDGASWSPAIATGLSSVEHLASNGLDVVAFETVSANYATSADGGATWTPGASPAFPITGIVTNGTTFVAATSGLVAWSTDSGVTWNPLDSAIVSAGPLTGLAYTVGSSMVAVDDLGSAFVSSDDGQTWSAAIPVTGGTGLSSVASTGLAAVAVDAGGFAYTSADGGVTWSAPISVAAPTPLVIVETDGLNVVAFDSLGFAYLSADGGATWGSAIAAATQATPAMVNVGAVFMATENTSNIVLSSDDGATWIFSPVAGASGILAITVS